MTVLEAQDHNLPATQQIELGLHRRRALRDDRITDVLENLLRKSLG